MVQSDHRLTIRIIEEKSNLNYTTVYQILTNELVMRNFGEMGPKKAKISKSKIKTMFICFFDSNGFIQKEFLPTVQTVDQHFYREILERLRK